MSPTANGYFAVIIPELKLWQGFFHIPVSNTDEIMATARHVHDLHPEDHDESRIHRSTPGVAMEDQAFFGALQAALVDRVIARDMNGIAQFAPMVAKIARTTYFWIEAELQPAGTVTQFGRLRAASIEAARDEIRALPAVRALTQGQ